jgi:hypothetical protein
MPQSKHFPCVFHQENAIDQVEIIIIPYFILTQTILVAAAKQTRLNEILLYFDHGILK